MTILSKAISKEEETYIHICLYSIVEIQLIHLNFTAT